MEDTKQAPQKKKDHTETINLLSSRLKLAKKFGEKWRKLVDKWLDDYEIESFDKIDHDDLYNKLQIPYIFSTVESNLPAMFETMPQLIMTHRGKRDEEFTKWVEQIWEYLVERLSLEEKIEDGGTMLLITGLMSFITGWCSETEEVEDEQEVEIKNDLGEVVEKQVVKKPIEVLVKDLPYVNMPDYDRIFFSPESKFTVDDDENKIPYFFFHETMDPDAVKDKYKVAPTEKAYFDVTKLDNKMDIEDGDLVKSDLRRVNVYHYYGQLPKKQAPKGWKSRYVYYAVFAGKQLLEEPKLVSKKPLVLQGNYGTPVKFHRFGEPKVLRELEQDISLGRSVMADYRDKMATKLFMPKDAEFDEASLKSPRKFATVKSTSNVPPSYIQPPPVPSAVGETINQDRTDIQMSSAQLDISRGGDSNTVQTATGQQIFQNAVERRINRKRKKIGAAIKALAKQILLLCAVNWDVDTFAKITDDQDLQKVSDYVEKLKDIGNDYDVDIEVETIMTNRATRSAQAIAFYKEIKDDPLVNREEILKFVIETGFGRKDPERFINTMVTPTQVSRVLEMLVQSGAIDPAVAETVMTQMSGQDGTAPSPASDGSIPTNETALNAQANSSEVANVPESA